MAVTNYYTIDGQILGYKDAGGRKDFLTDVLGSVTGEVDQTGANRTFNGRYKPYGGMLWSSGSRGSFGWVGTLGYKSTGLKNSSHYIRARHYSQTSGMWTTQDPLWKSEPMYRYVRAKVVSRTDKTGYKPDIIGGNGSIINNCCKSTSRFSDTAVRDQIKQCMKKSAGDNVPPFDSGDAVDWFLDVIDGYCNGTGKRKDRKVPDNNLCIRVASNGDIPGWPKECSNPCKSGFWAYTYPSPDPHPLPKDHCGLDRIINDCDPPSGPKGPCSCTIVMCDGAFGNIHQSACAVLYHELSHCTGLGHPEIPSPGPGIAPPIRKLDFVYKLACCICTVLNNNVTSKCGVECDRVK